MWSLSRGRASEVAATALSRTAGAAAASRSAGARRRLAAAAVADVGDDGPTARDPKHVRRLYDALRAKFGYIGAVDHKKVGAPDLFQLLRDSRTSSDFFLGMQAMNVYYNFGVKLRHHEIASRFLAAAMVCKVETEAVELIKLYGTWLQHPPDTSLVYAVMGHYLDAGEHMVVREIAQAVRQDWRIPVEPPLYSLAIEAMLQLPERPLDEALLLHADARQVGVRLPAPLHVRLLDFGLTAFNATSLEGLEGAEAEEALAPLRGALRAADGLTLDGHLRGGANAATLCSLSWLLWHLERLPEAHREAVKVSSEERGALAAFSTWQQALRSALDNFGCHWGFSGKLPEGFFSALEASEDPEVAELLAVARKRFGRFYPANVDE